MSRSPSAPPPEFPQFGPGQQSNWQYLEGGNMPDNGRPPRDRREPIIQRATGEYLKRFPKACGRICMASTLRQIAGALVDGKISSQGAEALVRERVDAARFDCLYPESVTATDQSMPDEESGSEQTTADDSLPPPVICPNGRLIPPTEPRLSSLPTLHITE